MFYSPDSRKSFLFTLYLFICLFIYKINLILFSPDWPLTYSLSVCFLTLRLHYSFTTYTWQIGLYLPELNQLCKQICLTMIVPGVSGSLGRLELATHTKLVIKMSRVMVKSRGRRFQQHAEKRQRGLVTPSLSSGI